MADQELLLSYLFPKFRGSKEDIVTLSLCHILSASNIMSDAFTNELCRRLQINTLEHLHYRPQTTGKNLERPDISGLDSSGTEMLICEAKFFAGLTSNQPGAYIERLIGRRNTGLIFICPESRILSLWNQISHCINDSETIGDRCVSIHGVHMSIISWDDLLGVLFQASKQCDSNILADLNQLEGICKKIENTEFMPFSDDDLSMSAAKNIERYYMVIDDVVNAILAQDELPSNTRKLHSAGGHGYYTRYINIWDIGIGITFSTACWKSKSALSTPFWMWIWSANRDGLWDVINRLMQSPELSQQTEKDGVGYLALIPPTDAFRDEVVASLSDQVLSYIRRIKSGYESVAQTDSE